MSDEIADRRIEGRVGPMASRDTGSIDANEAIARALAHYGGGVLFGLMGDANMRYIARFVDGGGSFVRATIESAAVGMADGYARATGRCAAVSLTHGPGLTNAVTSLVTATRASTPLLVISSATATWRRLQAIELVRVAGLAGCRYRPISTSHGLVREIGLAVHEAQRDGVPVIVDIAESVLDAMLEFDAPRFRLVTHACPTPDGAVLDEAAALIAASRCPIILAGRGAVLAEGREPLARLADRAGGALATTLLAKDYFSDHPLDLGVLGQIAWPETRAMLDESDCIVAFGASLNEFTTEAGALLRGRSVIQCDIDGRKLQKRYPVDIAIIGDAAIVAASLAAAVSPPATKPAALRTRHSAHAADFVDPAPGRVDIRAAAIEIDRLLPRDRVFVSDGGRFQFAPWRYLRVADPRDFHLSLDFGAIGLGAALALGVAVADPQRTVVCVAGDGGAMMQFGELRIAVERRLPVVLVIMNDSAYGSEWHKLRGYGLDPRHSRFEEFDFAAVARAMGCRAQSVTSLRDLAILADYDVADGPLVIDVKCDPAIDILAT